LFELGKIGVNLLFSTELVVIIRAKVNERLTGQNMVYGNQDGMGNGDNSSFLLFSLLCLVRRHPNPRSLAPPGQ